ncbi:MAG: BACON domain-containing carbohydrate-binding protein [Mucinivorans sp.]
MKTVIKILSILFVALSVVSCKDKGKDAMFEVANTNSTVYMIPGNNNTYYGTLFLKLVGVEAGELGFSAPWCTVSHINSNYPDYVKVRIKAQPNTSAAARSCVLTITNKATGEQKTATVYQPVSNIQFEVPKEGGQYNVSDITGFKDAQYESNSASDYEFMKLVVTSPKQLTLVVEPNLNGVPRTQEVFIYMILNAELGTFDDLVSVPINVVQLQGLGLVATPSQFSFTSAGGTLSAQVSNPDWWYDPYMSISTWCRIKKEADNSLSITTKPNTTGAPRSGEITIFTTIDANRVYTKLFITQD